MKQRQEELIFEYMDRIGTYKSALKLPYQKGD